MGRRGGSHKEIPVMNEAHIRTSVYGKHVNWVDEAENWKMWASAWFVALLCTNALWAIAWIARGLR